MKTLLLCGSLLVSTAGIASAAGVNLGWLDCAPTGANVRTFACNSNAGVPNILVGSFVAGDSLTLVTGVATVIDLQVSDAALPDWWQLATGGCRGVPSLVLSYDFTAGPFSCTDYWQGGTAGGGLYFPAFNGPNRARYKHQGALPANDSRIGPIAVDTPVYLFKLTINNAKSTGAGACVGCASEACIVHNSSQITQVPGTPGGNRTYSSPANSGHVIWQAWTTGDPNNQCPAVTPTKNHTWGSIKAIYR